MSDALAEKKQSLDTAINDVTEMIKLCSEIIEEIEYTAGMELTPSKKRELAALKTSNPHYLSFAEDKPVREAIIEEAKFCGQLEQDDNDEIPDLVARVKSMHDSYRENAIDLLYAAMAISESHFFRITAEEFLKKLNAPLPPKPGQSQRPDEPASGGPE